MKGKMVMGFVAGGMMGLAAAAMSVPGYRNMVVKMAKQNGKKMLKVAKQILPL